MNLSVYKTARSKREQTHMHVRRPNLKKEACPFEGALVCLFSFFLIVWVDLNLGEDTLHAAGSRLLAGGRGLLLLLLLLVLPPDGDLVLVLKRLQLFLLRFELLLKLLLQSRDPLLVRRHSRQDLPNRPLDQDSSDEPEALALVLHAADGLDHELVLLKICVELAHFLIQGIHLLPHGREALHDLLLALRLLLRRRRRHPV
mmetsp:Transcript_9751/g.24357  ORF Transcript_9751/g.24357 Transcript_9751/m.24357 type:complete len:201 (+) Transcript_9751:24-626(+)